MYNDLSAYQSPHLPTLEVLGDTYIPVGQAKPTYLGVGKTDLFDPLFGFEGKSMTKADYEEWLRQRRRGQHRQPLITCVPDDCKICLTCPQEALHSCLRTMDHNVDTAISISDFDHENLHNPPVKKKLDINKGGILPEVYKIPMCGLAGAKTTMWQKDPAGFIHIMAPGQPEDEQLKATSNLHHSNVSPSAYPMVVSTFKLNELLQVVFDPEPKLEDILSFEAKALAYGNHWLANFPDRPFNHYQHYLICPSAQFLRELGSLGRWSSVVCEAANRFWKFGRKSGRNINQSRSTMAQFLARTYRRPV